MVITQEVKRADWVSSINFAVVLGKLFACSNGGVSSPEARDPLEK